jgi:hypothetical protein
MTTFLFELSKGFAVVAAATILVMALHPDAPQVDRTLALGIFNP